MKNIFIVFIMTLSIHIGAQDYFSRILATEDNPLIKVLKKIDDQYLIPTDFFSDEGVKGGLLIVDILGEVNTTKFENMDLGLSPIVIVDNQIYLSGENPFNEGDTLLFVSKLDHNNYMQEYFKEFRIKGSRTINTSLKYLNGNLYTLNVNYVNLSETIPKNNQIFKISLSGNELWNITLDDDKAITNGYVLITTFDSALMVSANFVNVPSQGARAKLTKISQNGTIIWNYEGEEKLANGAVPTWATELSDSTILQTYYVDKSQDVDFIVNNWFPLANRFIWLSKDGELIREKLIITEFEDRIVYDGVESGQGEYFYSYGYLESLDPDPGLKYSCHLTKFSNQGDTIWTHNYRHSNYSGNNIIYNIKDIIEEDNGDITVLADIRVAGAKTEVWLFKVNSEGCYVNEECEDIRDLTSINTTQSSNVTISPNPTSGLINVECSTNIKKIKLIEITGKPIKNINVNSKRVDFDLLDVDEGIYILQVIDEFSKTISKKIIKM